MPGESIITATAAGRRFGDREVLHGVDLDVRAGEVLGLIGQNGSGKSTLLLMFAGLIAPTSGRVQVGETDATEVALSGAGQIGLVTANPGLYPLLTGRENLHYFGGLFGFSPAEVDARAEPVLDRVGLPGIDRPVGTYSSGMKQKLALVRALLTGPRVLLLDEPSANLDPLSASLLYESVREQADAGTAVVLCTHDLHAAEHMCERVATLLEGRLIDLTEQAGPRGAPPRSSLLGSFGGPS